LLPSTTSTIITINITRSTTIKNNNLLLKVMKKRPLLPLQPQTELLLKNLLVMLLLLLPLNKNLSPTRLLMLPKEMLPTL